MPIGGKKEKGQREQSPASGDTRKKDCEKEIGASRSGGVWYSGQGV